MSAENGRNSAAQIEEIGNTANTFTQIDDQAQFFKDVVATGERGKKIINDIIMHTRDTVGINITDEERSKIEQMRRKREDQKHGIQMMAG